MALSVKNMLGGGGGSNAPYSWKKYSVETITIENPEYSFTIGTSTGYTGNRIKFVLNIPDEYSNLIDVKFFDGVTFENSDGTTTFFTINNGELVYLNKTYKVEYYAPDRMLVVFGLGTVFATSSIFRFHGTKSVLKYHFAEYVLDKNRNAYPDSDIASDGFYYEYANTGTFYNVKSSFEKRLSEVPQVKKNISYESYYANAIEFRGEIHLIGTQQSNYSAGHYKLVNGTTVTLPNPPFSPQESKALVFNDELHIFGGTSVASQHWKWDGETWTQLTNINYSFGRAGACVYNNEVHLLGSNSSSYSQRHSVWNGESYRLLDNIPFNATYSDACTLSDGIHLFGSAQSAYYYTHWKWDGETWTQLTNIPTNTGRLSGCRCFTMGDSAIVLGSSYSESYYIDVWNNGEWTMQVRSEYTTRYGCGCAFGDTAYLFASNFYVSILGNVKFRTKECNVVFTDLDENTNLEYDYHENYAHGYLYYGNSEANNRLKIYHGLGAKPKYVIFKSVAQGSTDYNTVLYGEYNVEQGSDYMFYYSAGSNVKRITIPYIASGSPTDGYSKISVDENYFYIDKCYGANYEGSCRYIGGYSWFAIL